MEEKEVGMNPYRIAVMEGDGIGPEIVKETVKIIKAALQVSNGVSFKFVNSPVGFSAYEQTGFTIPSSIYETIEGCHGWILGPVTTHLYEKQNMQNPSGVFRKKYNLYANVRPAVSLEGIACMSQHVDLVVVRENTEGMYSDRSVLDGNGEFRTDEDTVISIRVITRKASERVARYAFELAAKRKKKKVTIIHKANVLKRGCGLFLEVCREIAKEYPNVEVNDMHVDAMAMRMITHPQNYDVLLCTNLFGDILSDEAAGLVGGLGLAPGLNVGESYAMAQATHGSAPDIEGKEIANPWAEIMSAAMLLDWMGNKYDDQRLCQMSTTIQNACGQVLLDKTRVTPDLGGTSTTSKMGSAIASIILEGEMNHE
jgi:3-isopropylmalate dehydrogenase